MSIDVQEVRIMMLGGDGFFSRETLAGYDRGVLDGGVLAVVGCGAAGNNIALNLALAGVAELRFIDFDHVEPSNATRSPLFHRDRLLGTALRHKAREIAMGTLTVSHAPEPVVRFAITPVESLGLGAFIGSGAIVAAVDSFAVRAYLADISRLLRIPLIEIGFSGSQGHVSVFPNQTAEEPCWRCLHPHVSGGNFSCAAYARKVLAEGRIPATQPLAASLSGIAAEATIQALHGRFPMGGKALHLDIRTGQSRLLDLALDPVCPGEHRLLRDVQELDLTADEPALKLLEAARATVPDPVLRLPSPLVVEAPCATCGSLVHLMKPAWRVTEAPVCEECPATPTTERGELIVTRLRADDQLARTSLKKLGVGPCSIVEVEDRGSGQVAAFRLQGSIEALYATKKRKAATAPGPSDV